MAGPIKISVLADVGQAVKNVTHFSDITEENTHRVVTSLGDPKLTGGFGKAQEGFDVLDTRAMGFRDTITGVQDTMTGFQGLLGDRKPGQTFADSLLQVGMGVGDLASGMANFIIPMTAMASGLPKLTIAFRALNITMLANPIFLVITLVIALVAIFVIAYKKSETFRNIVDGAFRGVLSAVTAVWGWIKGHWPLLFAILTGPVGLAVRWIIGHWDQIGATIRAFPGKVRGWIGDLGGLLKQAGMRLIRGFVDGILGQFGAVRDTLGSLTSKLTSWKGPPGRDRQLLRRSGELVMEGFDLGLAGRFQTTRRNLSHFTTSLAGLAGSAAAGAGITAGAAGGPRLQAVLRLPPTGRRADDLLIELLRERIASRYAGDVDLALSTA